jgi:hypothetical protein
MTALQWILKEAKKLKKEYPKRFAKWTDYVAQASAIYAKKHKGKSPVGKKKAARKTARKTAKRKVSGVKDSAKVRKELAKKGLKMPHGYQTTKRVHRIAGVRKKKISEQSILNRIHKVKEDVSKLDEAQHKHMMGTIKKNFKNFIQYKKHIIDVVVTPSGKKMYFASVHPLSMPFSTNQLNIAKKWIDKHIAIKRIKSSK